MDKRIEIARLLKAESEQLIGTTVNVKGWVRTKRGNKNVAFIALNDGSIIHNIQVVVDPAKFEEELKRITTGACISVNGKLVTENGTPYRGLIIPGSGQMPEALQRHIEKLKAQGAEAVILGCTEIGGLIRQDDSVLPIFDTTVIHAESAARFAVS